MHLDQYMGLECQNILHGKLIDLGEAGAMHFSSAEVQSNMLFVLLAM